MKTRILGLTILTLLSLLPVICSAGENDSSDQSGNAPKAASAAGANWWTQSALENATPPPQFLYHIEGTLSYMDASGNTNGFFFRGQTEFDIRKGRFTDRVIASISKQDIAYFGQGKSNFSEDTLRNELEFAVTRRSLLVAGIEDYRNTLMFMDERLTEYAGGGLTFSGKGASKRWSCLRGLGFRNLPSIEPASAGSIPMQ